MPNQASNRLYRARDERMFLGVAAGLGHYFDIDPTLIRIGFALTSLFAGGSGLLVYLVLAIVTPEAPEGDDALSADETILGPPPDSAVETAADEDELIDNEDTPERTTDTG